MATKYHINDKGEAGVCNAVHKCRFGREADQHYDTVEEARTAYEKEKIDELFSNGVSKDKLGRRELNQLVKYTDDRETFRKGLETKSPRIRASILGNRNADAETLREIYATASDTEKKAVVSHRNYPISDMNAAELETAIKARMRLSHQYRQDVFKDNGINDSHKETLQKMTTLEIVAAAGNMNNQLTPAVRQELLNQNSNTKTVAIQKGNLPSTEIRNLDAAGYRSITMDMHRINNPAALDQIVGVALSKKFSNHDNRIVLEKAVYNDNLSQNAIKAIAHSDFNDKDSADYSNAIDRALYSRPSIDDDTKAFLINRSPEVASLAKLEKKAERYGGMSGLKKKLFKKYEQQSSGMSYRTTRVELDKEELKKLNLNKDDVLTLMNRSAYNATFSYDEESGVFIGSIDSSG